VALAAAPLRDATVLLLVAGFGIKLGLVPLHVWLPLAHGTAPAPASAVLSGAMIKAGLFGLLSFLPLGTAPMADWGWGLAWLGLLTAYWGIAAGLAQTHPKTILAYSSMSQMGIAAVAVGAGLAEPGRAGAAVAAAALYALHHGLAKGALFMGAGLHDAAGSAAGRRLVLAGQAAAALSVAGLPLAAGGAAKHALKEVAGHGAVGTLVGLSAIGTTLLLARFLLMLHRAPHHGHGPGHAHGHAHAGLAAPWLAALVASQAAAWWLAGPAHALEPSVLWDGLWPVLAGAALALAAFALRGRLRGVSVPAGDVVVLAAPLGPMAKAAVGRLRAARTRVRPPDVRRLVEDGLAALESRLTDWQSAGTAFLLLIAVVAAALLLRTG
jgi:formate hydrogenlyase subunit 3/multisubunit Na+/H+ antiporter MnhD subunit